ncbi:MAG: hypothetical protein LBJ92_00430 [Holosporales bacterium]|jgi:hypothetical protein|nr:hypothetical protein [Holosporales bacterium]
MKNKLFYIVVLAVLISDAKLAELENGIRADPIPGQKTNPAQSSDQPSLQQVDPFQPDHDGETALPQVVPAQPDHDGDPEKDDQSSQQSAGMLKLQDQVSALSAQVAKLVQSKTPKDGDGIPRSQNDEASDKKKAPLPAQDKNNSAISDVVDKLKSGFSDIYFQELLSQAILAGTLDIVKIWRSKSTARYMPHFDNITENLENLKKLYNSANDTLANLFPALNILSYGIRAKVGLCPWLQDVDPNKVVMTEEIAANLSNIITSFQLEKLKWDLYNRHISLFLKDPSGDNPCIPGAILRQFFIFACAEITPMIQALEDIVPQIELNSNSLAASFNILQAELGKEQESPDTPETMKKEIELKKEIIMHFVNIIVESVANDKEYIEKLVRTGNKILKILAEYEAIRPE